ncbi:MAG: plasmid stabilization protein [Sphingobacteriia bacterium 28-36-52]|nr:MAG: plasmid stabilization protein [Sphingobacteriia bacterium 28-36-52]
MPYSKEEKKQKSEYTVFILASAQKQLDKLPNSVATRIEDKLMELSVNPKPSGCKKLKGRDAYRIRTSDYRAIYDIVDNKLIITVINVVHRKDVYQ